MIMQEMDFKSIIFHSARDGKLDRLKVFLDHRSKDEVLMLVDAKTNGATPLVMACRNGHYDVAQYLIELCNADLEQTGSVVFDGETIEGAPPLWCAAAAGHMSIVRLLVRHNARVNSTTRTNSTPLRAACFDGHFEIVKYLVDHGADIEVANRHGHTCLMIACYKGHYRIAKYLLKLNANVNRKSVKGNTSLHDCAESGSLEILKLLIEHNAKMDVDSYGMTPLLAASVTGHSHIVEYLIHCTGLVSKAERIDALELLGATYIDKKRDMIGGLDLWKRAMEDRYEGGTNAYMKPLQTKFVPAYDNMKEIRDLEGLEDLLADPDEMRMQALAVRERILGPAHPDTSYYIRYRGAVYADAGKFHRCISLWTYALDMQQSMLDPLNPMTQSSLFSFTELFSFMMGEQGRPTTRSRRVPPASYEDMLSIFNKAINEVEAGAKLISELPVEDRDITYLHRVLVISLHLACLLVRVLPTVSEEKKFEAYKTVYRLVKLGVRGQRGQTVLHLVASRDAAGPVGRYPVCEFPAPELAAVLMATGADATAVDDEGNTPLHTAVKSHPCPPVLARTLLDNGAHLDTVNKEGLTFKDLLKGQALSEIVNPLHYTTLGCLAAKVIRKHNIEYRNLIPTSLEKFVEQH